MNKQAGSLLNLSFIPQSHDLGLLVLRIWLGASMFLLHGKDKLTNFSETVTRLSGFVKVPSFLAAGAVFAESIFALLIILGLLTRISAAFLIGTMGVAFFVAHKGILSGEGNGELSFIYLAGFVTLFLTGAGKFSVDHKLLR